LEEINELAALRHIKFFQLQPFGGEGIHHRGAEDPKVGMVLSLRRVDGKRRVIPPRNGERCPQTPNSEAQNSERGFTTKVQRGEAFD
jgi:hypothetical protein